MLTVFSSFALTVAVGWLALRLWYAKLVRDARAEIRDAHGRSVPGPDPRLLTGSLLDVYRAENRLSVYHAFHEKFGAFVQIFWMWRSLLSVADYRLARYVLVARQNNYQKFLRRLFYLRRLFGSSVLTKTGSEWLRDRRLLNGSFAKKAVEHFHDIFVAYSEQLAAQWQARMEGPKRSLRLDVHPELEALFLDIVGKAALSHEFGALHGKLDDFLASLRFILEQSLRPTHAFIKSWHKLPLPSKRKIEHAFRIIDGHLTALIRNRRQATATKPPEQCDVLDLVVRSALSDREVRDNLVAVVINGHETVGTSTALTLSLLARHPENLARVRTELDRVLATTEGRLSKTAVARLHYLDCVVSESLRLYPPIVGLNRICMQDDVLGGWSVPRGREIGIALMPLHLDRRYFGDRPEQFRPERYLEGLEGDRRGERRSAWHRGALGDLPPRSWQLATNHDSTVDGTAPEREGCPVQSVHRPTTDGLGRTQAGVCLPLSFGDGKRKCLGEHFARYEMKVALAVLLHQFDFEVPPGFDAEVEIKRHGLAVSLFPKHGVHLDISRRASSDAGDHIVRAESATGANASACD